MILIYYSLPINNNVQIFGFLNIFDAADPISVEMNFTLLLI
ncbi:hypothetical protein LCGC14_2249230, partial [marine sediment metagenome]